MLSSSYYYTLYGAAGVRALPTTETIYGAILCGTDGEVEFDGVAKPSDAAGFFTIGVKETPDVRPSDSEPHVPAPYLGGNML